MEKNPMLTLRRGIITTIASGVLAASFGATTTAAASSQAFGDDVATCARASLGQRDNPPTVTCVHDGMTMTFPNFGAMVQHMRSIGE